MLFCRLFMLLSLYVATAHTAKTLYAGMVPAGDEVSRASSHAGDYGSRTDAADPFGAAR